MNLDNYIKQLIKLRDENNCGDFQMAKWETFEKNTCFEGRLTALTKNDIEIYKDEKVIAIKTDFHPQSD